MLAAAGIVAHGGTGGLVVELSLLLGLLAVVGLVWLRSRTAGDAEVGDENHDRAAGA